MVALATGISANWSTIVSMFGSWVIVTAIVIVIVAGALGLLSGLLLGGLKGAPTSNGRQRSYPRNHRNSPPPPRAITDTGRR